jgi:hypothetical protein
MPTVTHRRDSHRPSAQAAPPARAAFYSATAERNMRAMSSSRSDVDPDAVDLEVAGRLLALVSGQ